MQMCIMYFSSRILSSACSPAVRTVHGSGLLSHSGSQGRRRNVLRLKKLNRVNSTSTAFTTHTTSQVRWMSSPVSSDQDYTNILLIPCVLSDWSTCQLSDRAVCGYGLKTRMLDCVRSDGKSVDLSFCKEVRHVPPNFVFRPFVFITFKS